MRLLPKWVQRTPWLREWFSGAFSVGSERLRGQVRLLALASLVGIVAGLGAIGFYVATRVVEHYALWCGGRL